MLLILFFFSLTLNNEKSTNSKHLASTHFRRERTVDHIERSGSSTTDNEMPITSTVTTHHQKKTMITSPKQRYYLGENPYGGSIFGKENKYQNGASRDSEIVKQKNYYNSAQIHPPARRQRSEEPTVGWVWERNFSCEMWRSSAYVIYWLANRPTSFSLNLSRELCKWTSHRDFNALEVREISNLWA